MSLLFLTSPAKTLDLSDNWQKNTKHFTLPHSLKMATDIANLLKEKSESDFKKILNVSDSIANLNYERMISWVKDHTKENSKPAILIYDGAVYKQIDSNHFNKKQQDYTQNHVRIISGFYGLLKPYDLIQPYRLEMNNKLNINNQNSLVKYWKNDITKLLNKEIKENDITSVINLASKEYSQTIDTKKLSVPFISIDFKEKRDGKLKTIAIYAKLARGKMINQAIIDNIKNIEELTKLNISGYTFLKKEDAHFIFTKK